MDVNPKLSDNKEVNHVIGGWYVKRGPVGGRMMR